MTISTLKYPTDRSSPAFFKAAGIVSRSRVTLPDMSRAVIKNFMDFSVVERPSFDACPGGVKTCRPSLRKAPGGVTSIGNDDCPNSTEIVGHSEGRFIGERSFADVGKPSSCAALRQRFSL